METTIVLLKPDCVERGFIGEIISRIENANLSIVKMQMTWMSEDQVKLHYNHLIEEDYFPRILKFMISGPVVVMSIMGKNAITIMKKLIGDTDPAKALPGTIRGDYCHDLESGNLIHASDSPENSIDEHERFFK